MLSTISSGTQTVAEQEIRVLGVDVLYRASLAYLAYLRNRNASPPPHHLVERGSIRRIQRAGNVFVEF